LTACATSHSATADDDERLARNADSQRSRDGSPAPAKTEPAPAQQATKGDVQAAAQAAMAEAAIKAAQLQQAKTSAEGDCAALGTRDVAWSEQRAMGEAFVAHWAQGNVSIYLDAPGTPPGSPQDPLPAGAKNDVTAYVQRIGAVLTRRLSAHWTFGVIDDDKPLALAVIGDFVFITTGLLKKLENEAELAAMLAHEITRVANKEPIASYQQALVRSCQVQVMNANMMAGMGDLGASPEFQSKMRQGASTAPVDPADPSQQMRVTMLMQSMMLTMVISDADLEYSNDAKAFELLEANGYYARALSAAFKHIDANALKNRIANLAARDAKLKKPGKKPAFPPDVKLPK
jgi:Zn-dependent protease with chaperone function